MPWSWRSSPAILSGLLVISATACTASAACQRCPRLPTGRAGLSWLRMTKFRLVTRPAIAMWACAVLLALGGVVSWLTIPKRMPG